MILKHRLEKLEQKYGKEAEKRSNALMTKTLKMLGYQNKPYIARDGTVVDWHLDRNSEG